MQYFDNPQDSKESLDELLVRYRDMAAELQPAIDQLKALKEQVKERALEDLEPGEAVEVEGVTLSIRNGYSRTYWKTKELEGLAIAYPELNELKTVREYGPSAVIKVEV